MQGTAVGYGACHTRICYTGTQPRVTLEIPAEASNCSLLLNPAMVDEVSVMHARVYIMHAVQKIVKIGSAEGVALQVHALQFEWAWQNPHKSTRTKTVTPKLRRRHRKVDLKVCTSSLFAPYYACFTGY